MIGKTLLWPKLFDGWVVVPNYISASRYAQGDGTGFGKAAYATEGDGALLDLFLDIPSGKDGTGMGWLGNKVGDGFSAP